jgi:hypothetical protein
MQHYSATELQAMVRNMDESKKKYKSLKLRDPAAYEQKVGEENIVLFNDFYSIFKKHLKDELDETFFYMLDQKRKIEKGELTEDQAAVAVGQKLFDRWISPVISNAEVPKALSYEEYYKTLSK